MTLEQALAEAAATGRLGTVVLSAGRSGTWQCSIRRGTSTSHVVQVSPTAPLALTKALQRFLATTDPPDAPSPPAPPPSPAMPGGVFD